MTTQTLLTLFLASPGDVNPERAIVRKVVDEFNDSLGKLGNVRVQVIGWDTDSRPSWGADAQNLLNGQIGNMTQHALFVGIFWNRVGTPTPRAKSGTIEEFQNAAKLPKSKRPEIMLYFNQKAATLTLEQTKQRADLLEWKKTLQTQGIYWDFKGTSDFEKVFRKHYGDWLREKISPRVPAPTTPARASSKAVEAEATEEKPRVKRSPVVKKATPKPNTSKLYPILLDGHLFWAENVLDGGSNWTLTLRSQDASDDRKIRALSSKRQWHEHFSLAFGLQGGKAQSLEEGQRSSDAKGELWTLKLRFTPAQSSAGMAVNFNGMSADEIAQKKAEWLLLAQPPAQPVPQHPWEQRDRWLEQQIMGNGDEKQPIFPSWWKQVKGDKAKFAAGARLYAVSRLLSQSVCDTIEKLEVGAIRAGTVKVTFHGTRPSVMSQEEQSLVIEGTCSLDLTL